MQRQVSCMRRFISGQSTLTRYSKMHRSIKGVTMSLTVLSLVSAMTFAHVGKSVLVRGRGGTRQGAGDF